MSKSVEILITLPMAEETLGELQQISLDFNIAHFPTNTHTDIPADVLINSEVLYTFQAIPEPEQAPNLQWLQYYLAGVERLLPLPICKKEDLVITTMSGANASQVAEHALALLLGLCRRLPVLFDRQGNGEWLEDRATAYQPVELRGSTVGIVGYGSIGRQVARLLKPFGVSILASKQNVMQPEDLGYMPKGLGDPEGDLFTRLYPHQALRSMFRQCDYVVVTVPLTRASRGLIGSAELAELPPQALLVDVSRGGVVDHAALINALEEGKIGGASLDVFPEEPLSPGSPLWDLPNVIISPHVAGFSQHYASRAVELFTLNLQRYLDNQPLYNQLDIKKGY